MIIKLIDLVVLGISYGKSEGRPSQDGIRLDAEAALDFIDEHISLAGTPVVRTNCPSPLSISLSLLSSFPGYHNTWLI